METIVPPVTTPGLTPGTDNGGVGGSLDVSGSGLEGLKPGISVNVSVQGGLDGLVASLKLNINQPIVPNSGQAESDSQYSNLTAAGKSSVSRRN